MDMKRMMKQAQMMQRNMEKVQAEVAEMENTAEAGGGMVKATVSGDEQLKSITINKDVVDPEDVEMLEDLVCAAVNEALKGMKEISQSKMSSVTGGLNIPGL